MVTQVRLTKALTIDYMKHPYVASLVTNQMLWGLYLFQCYIIKGRIKANKKSNK